MKTLFFLVIFLQVTSVSFAAMESDKLTVQVEKTTTEDVPQNKDEALRIAAPDSNQKQVEVLISEGGLDIDATDDLGATAIYYAALQGNTEIVKLLLSQSANVDGAGPNHSTALIAAAANGQLSVAHLLIDAGADLNVETTDGVSALSAAKAGGHTEISSLLEEAGAKT